MGNCVKPVDPLSALIPRSTDPNVTAIKEATVPIIFLIGGPGAGKTTQCAHIEKRYGFCTVITRELLRDEVATGSQRGIILAHLMSKNEFVPPDVMVQLIETKMLSKLGTTRGFLVSGFPREKMQCKYFNSRIRPPDLVLYLLVRNSLLTDRVMARTVTTTERHMWSIDEHVQKIKTFHERIKPVLRCYRRRIVVIDGEKEEMEVFRDICNAIDNVLKNFPSSST